MNVCCYWHLWFCGVTDFFTSKVVTGQSRLSRLSQVVGTWEPGGEKMEGQRRNVESKWKGREEE